MYVKFIMDFSCFNRNDIVDVPYTFADLLMNELMVATRSNKKVKEDR